MEAAEPAYSPSYSEFGGASIIRDGGYIVSVR
jgi:hypothetical protein